MSGWLRVGFGSVGLMVLCQVGLLSKLLAANLAGEGFLPGAGPHMNVDTVLVLEALVADVAVVQQTAFLLRFLSWPSVVLSDFGNVAGEVPGEAAIGLGG